LLRRYAQTGRPDLFAALDVPLALLAASSRGAPSPDLVAALAEALPLSGDERLLSASRDIAASAPLHWRRLPRVEALRWLDSGLMLAAALTGTAERAAGASLAQAAIEEVERSIGRDYLPGEGLGADAGVRAHVAAANALISAYITTGRLAYPMLAEEL